jgi:hypothetical protein
MRRLSSALAAGVTLVSVTVAGAQQVADPNFNPKISQPTHKQGEGPRVSVDAAHLNFHTADDRYAPFARLLRSDGYRVDSNTASWRSSSLTERLAYPPRTFYRAPWYSTARGASRYSAKPRCSAHS